MPASGAELWDAGDEAGPRTEGSKLGNWKPQPLLESQGFGGDADRNRNKQREAWVCFQLQPCSLSLVPIKGRATGGEGSESCDGPNIMEQSPLEGELNHWHGCGGGG